MPHRRHHQPLSGGQLRNLQGFIREDEPISYFQPSQWQNHDGQARRVGFELEFSGLSLEQASQALLTALGGVVVERTAAECLIEVEELGRFGVEVDWALLKSMAQGEAADVPHLQLLAKAATAVVPVEVVCPPIDMRELQRLDPMVTALREAGAQGTEDSILAAFGVHINTEIPDLSAATLDRYLKAYALLQTWLVDAHQVNMTRQLTPYIDSYSDDYLKIVLEQTTPTMATLMASYLTHNGTRNRALDLLPLFAEIDESAVERAVQDDRVKARPAFHYRLPNCLIDDPQWSLEVPWRCWCVVEQLANRPQDLHTLGAEFLSQWEATKGVDKVRWKQTIGQWVKLNALV